MAITRGAKKAHRNSLRKRGFNTIRKNKVSKALKSLKRTIVSADKKKAELELRSLQSALDKAVKGGTLSKNTASRRKSRISKLIKALS